jgi:hypothetical protein
MTRWTIRAMIVWRPSVSLWWRRCVASWWGVAVIDSNCNHGDEHDGDNIDDGSHDDDNAPRDGGVPPRSIHDDAHDVEDKADCHVVSRERAVGLHHSPLQHVDDVVADVDEALVEEADRAMTEPFVDAREHIVHTVLDHLL